jgi:Domain of unknown function (DUF3786)
MARIDDYQNARNLAVESLCRQPLAEILKRSGYQAKESDSLHIPFLDRTYAVSYPDFRFSDTADSAKSVPLQEQVLILHYLSAASPSRPAGRWIAYREIPGAAFYFSAFVKRAIDPLKKVFGNDTGALKKAVARLNGQPIAAGDAGFEFQALPRVPLQIILWEADEEFGAEGNILFDQNVGEILTPEDVAWLAGMLVYRLMALAR